MRIPYCFSCMEPLDAEGAPCRKCGRSPQYEAPAHHLKPGTVLQKKYLIGRALGEGGFGITYLGRDTNLDMKVAVKEYYPSGYSHRDHNYTNAVTLTQVNQDQDFEKDMQRFLSEARMLAKFFDEPGIVCVRDFFRENGTAYIVMEYLDGITLKAYLHQHGPIPLDALLHMMEPVLKSLSRVHEQGMIHRDISPDNIMVLKNGQLKLLDFGAAREVTGDKSLSVVLKNGYAPAEQYWSKGKQGPWTDVYAMCATIYKCLTGITPMISQERAYEDTLQPPSKLGVAINPRQEAALMQGLSVGIKERLQSIAELYQGLMSAQTEEPVQHIHIQRHLPEDEIKTVYQSAASDRAVPEEAPTVYAPGASQEITPEDAPTVYEPVAGQERTTQDAAAEELFRTLKKLQLEKSQREVKSQPEQKPLGDTPPQEDTGYRVKFVSREETKPKQEPKPQPTPQEDTGYRVKFAPREEVKPKQTQDTQPKAATSRTASSQQKAPTGQTATPPPRPTPPPQATQSAPRKKSGKKGCGQVIKKLFVGALIITALIGVGSYIKETMKTSDIQLTELPGDDYYSLEFAGQFEDANRQMNIFHDFGLYKWESGSYVLYNYLGVDTTGKRYSERSYLGDGLYVVQEVSESINSRGLLNREGELLIPTEACLIRYPSYAPETDCRYVLVYYAQGVTTDEESALVYQNEYGNVYTGSSDVNTMYTGYIRVFDVVNRRFVENLPEVDHDYDVKVCGDNLLIESGGSAALYNPDGQIILDLGSGSCSVGKDFFVFSASGTYTVYDANGNITFYSNNYLYAIDDSSCIEMSQDGKYILLDCWGNVIYQEEYDYIASDGVGSHIRVKKDDKYGLIDSDGQEFLPCAFEYIYEFYGFEDSGYGYAETKFNTYLYGPEGIIVKCDSNSDIYNMNYIKDGMAFVINDRSFALEVGSADYMTLTCAMIALESEATGLYGAYDLFTGQELLPQVYEQIQYAADYLYAYKEGAWEVYKVTLTQ